MIRGPRNDLTGQTFNEWTALKYEGKSKYLCRCSCGVERVITSYALLTGRSKSCGHLPDTRIKDLTGQKFGEWTAIEYRGKARWLCRCSCGTERVIRSYDLRQGLEHCKNPIHNSVYNEGNLTGKHFGEWEVLKYAGGGNWLCRCSCGKEALVLTHHLIRGNSRSCGHTKIIDLTGKTFGEFKVLKYTGNGKWLCKCSCGKEAEVFGYNLRNGTSTSCGCKTVEKIKQTMLDRYGVDSYAKFATNRTEKQLEYIKSKDNIIKCIKDNFSYKPTIHELSRVLGMMEGNALKVVHKFGIEDLIQFGHTKVSSYEREIHSRFGGVLSDRTILGGNKEIDIYFPSNHIGIEINGNYWHSSFYKSKKYHQDKTLQAAKAGVRIIHLFEYELTDDDRKQKLYNLIYRLLNPSKSTILYEKECRACKIDKSVACIFKQKYSLYNIESNINIGLMNADELVAVASFDTPRCDTEYQYELLEIVFKNGIKIQNGIDKMIQYFVARYNPTSMITYCDISKFTGNSYIKAGFKLLGLTEPNYMWVKLPNSKVLSRDQIEDYIKTKDGLDIDTNNENDMNDLGYYKIYDCGNLKFEWRKA